MGELLAFAAAITSAIWLFSGSLPFESEVTVYRMFCTGSVKNGACYSKEETSGRTSYKAIVEAQSVVYWGEDYTPASYRHCAVRNTRNWSCSDGDPDVVHWEHKMVDGEFSERRTPHIPSIDLFYVVPRWKWWINRMLEKLR
jgi:hypothetical protein